MKQFLVIGGTGVAGTAAIKAIRQFYGDDAQVTALWFGRKFEELAIDGADRVLFADVSLAQTWDTVEAQCGRHFDAIFYATAMGDVGYPSQLTTTQQVADSNRLSFDPVPMLEQRFDVDMMVTYSTFFNLAHQRVTYGAMAHSKAALEAWTVAPGDSRRVCIRAGAFKSGSSTAIKLLVRRNAAKLAAMGDPILTKYFGGVKASLAVENMQQAVFDEERETFGDTGTDESGLVAAHLMLFEDTDAVFACVCGNKHWLDTEAQPAPDVADG